VSLEDLLRQGYQAVFLGLGAQKGLNLKLPGIENQGVRVALSMLADVHLGRTVDVGDKVVVIGGGNVAINAPGRLCVWCRRGQPGLSGERGTDSGLEWEIREAVEEGVKINYGLAPLEMVAKTAAFPGFVSEQ